MKSVPPKIVLAALPAILASLLIPEVNAQTNPGDPLFCQPQEGVAYLIVNGGGGIFTADGDCYGNNINNDVTTSITTSQGGTLTLTRTANSGNYTYTPPTPGFTGLDTFSIAVTTVWNGLGGTGSAGGSVRPGGPATLNITLNVLPATTTMTTPGVAMLVPVPPGFISGCSPVGNSGQGPLPGTIYGCVTGLGPGLTPPAHGTVTRNGNTIRYTPAAGYSGPDTFTYEVLGVNNDGTFALESGEVTMQVTVTPPTAATPAPSSMLLALLGMAALSAFGLWRRARMSQ